MVLDHVIPLAAGGESTIDNLCLCCYRCNEFKGAKHQASDPQTGATRSCTIRVMRIGAIISRGGWTPS
jgi:hypothetical protein